MQCEQKAAGEEKVILKRLLLSTVINYWRLLDDSTPERVRRSLFEDPLPQDESDNTDRNL